jgi:hypothetical protein
MKRFKRLVLLQLYKILEINLIQDNSWLFKNDHLFLFLSSTKINSYFNTLLILSIYSLIRLFYFLSLFICLSIIYLSFSGVLYKHFFPFLLTTVEIK